MSQLYQHPPPVQSTSRGRPHHACLSSLIASREVELLGHTLDRADLDRPAISPRMGSEQRVLGIEDDPSRRDRVAGTTERVSVAGRRTRGERGELDAGHQP